MYVYIYICVRICICVCVCICIYVYVYVYVYVYINIYMFSVYIVYIYIYKGISCPWHSHCTILHEHVAQHIKRLGFHPPEENVVNPYNSPKMTIYPNIRFLNIHLRKLKKGYPPVDGWKASHLVWWPSQLQTSTNLHFERTSRQAIFDCLKRDA